MKYYIWTLGCAMNTSDAERVASVLEALGYVRVSKDAEADLVIVLACSVRQTAIDRIYGKARTWEKRKKNDPEFRTVLSGCVLEDDRKKMAQVFDYIFEIEDLGKLPGMLGEMLAEDKTGLLGSSGEYLGIVPAYGSNFRAYVPIMTGCNNFCSYCAVPYTRGREKSRTRAEVVQEVRALVARGYTEITLLGQNVNSYANGFIELLSEIDRISGEYRIYFYSNHPKDMSDGLIKLLPTLKHFPNYIHLPLQSGSDAILRKMNRHYTRDDYLAFVGKIKKEIPDIALTTDIIVGYPGETEADFKQTLDVVRAVSYGMIFSAQYSPRPGTISAGVTDNVPKAEKKKREKAIIALLEPQLKKKNKELMGEKIRILVDGEKKGNYFGRTEHYKVVEIQSSQPLKIGHFYDVMIECAGAWKLVGKI